MEEMYLRGRHSVQLRQPALQTYASMKRRIEEKASDTILQRKKSIMVGGVNYEVSPPSIATLIEVSGLVSQLPRVQSEGVNIIEEVIRTAKDCRVIGDILAVLILGPTTNPKNTKHRLLGLKNRFQKEYSRLVEKILYDLSPSEVNSLTMELLKLKEIPDFFAITAFLSEINLLTPTGKAV